MIEPIPERLENALRQTLAPGERVFMQLKGAFKEALVCTDWRVIIRPAPLDPGQRQGTEVEEVEGSGGHGSTAGEVSSGLADGNSLRQAHRLDIRLR